MELWFIYALLSALFSGLFSFCSKISVEKNHNPALVTAYSSMIGLVCVMIALLFSDQAFGNIYIGMGLGLLNGILYSITTITRMKSLQYIDTSLYFPIYKAVGPVVMVAIVVLFFGETLDTQEIIGVSLGIIVPLILIGQNKKSKELKKGIIYLAIGLVTALIVTVFAKIAVTLGISPLNYLFFAFLFSGIFTFLLNIRGSSIEKSAYGISKIKRIGIITGILNFSGFYYFVKAIEEGNNLGVIYTVQSLYIIIPILLSIFYYSEHFDSKKFIAIVLTLASLFFLK